jgi:hypothetical protein
MKAKPPSGEVRALLSRVAAARGVADAAPEAQSRARAAPDPAEPPGPGSRRWLRLPGRPLRAAG